MQKILFLFLILPRWAFAESRDERNKRVAPLVELIAPGASSAVKTRLNLGRNNYVGARCLKCHVPETITDYSSRDWFSKIMPTMSRKARLTPSEDAELSDYIKAVLAYKP